MTKNLDYYERRRHNKALRRGCFAAALLVAVPVAVYYLACDGKEDPVPGIFLAVTLFSIYGWYRLKKA